MVNFTVSPSCGSYHVSKHPYKIMFQATTRVRNSEDLPHNLSGFNPLNYKDLMSGNLDTDFLVGKYAYVSIFCFLYNYCLPSSNIYFFYISIRCHRSNRGGFSYRSCCCPQKRYPKAFPATSEPRVMLNLEIHLRSSIVLILVFRIFFYEPNDQLNLEISSCFVVLLTSTVSFFQGLSYSNSVMG